MAFMRWRVLRLGGVVAVGIVGEWWLRCLRWMRQPELGVESGGGGRWHVKLVVRCGLPCQRSCAGEGGRRGCKLDVVEGGQNVPCHMLPRRDWRCRRSVAGCGLSWPAESPTGGTLRGR
eukprot:6484225-Amphidinium_carterae.1